MLTTIALEISGRCEIQPFDLKLLDGRGFFTHQIIMDSVHYFNCPLLFSQEFQVADGAEVAYSFPIRYYLRAKAVLSAIALSYGLDALLVIILRLSAVSSVLHTRAFITVMGCADGRT